MFFTNILRAVALLLALCLPFVAEAACRTTLHYVNGVMNENNKEAEKSLKLSRKNSRVSRLFVWVNHYTTAHKSC